MCTELRNQIKEKYDEITHLSFDEAADKLSQDIDVLIRIIHEINSETTNPEIKQRCKAVIANLEHTQRKEVEQVWDAHLKTIKRNAPDIRTVE